MVMKKILLSRLFLLLICATASWAGALQAQSPAASRATMTVSVQDLTSELRDGIARDLQQSNELRLVYACVPAGIMVFEQQTQASREQMREILTPVLEHRIARQRISMETMDRNVAEERCAQVRNR